MKPLLFSLLILSLLMGCSRRPPRMEQLALYHIDTPELVSTIDLQAISQTGFNGILITSALGQEALLTLAEQVHEHNLYLFTQVEASSQVEGLIRQHMVDFSIDGFLITSIERLTSAQRRTLRANIRRLAIKQEKSGQLWGKTGWLIGMTNAQDERTFIENTFGFRGENQGFNLYVDTMARRIFSLALQPNTNTTALINTYNNLRSTYGRKAQPILPLDLYDTIYDLPMATPFLGFTVSSSLPFIYSNITIPSNDSFFPLMKRLLTLKSQYPALQEAHQQVLNINADIYSDVVTNRSQQIVRIFNFHPSATIFRISYARNIVKSSRLVDIETGEVIQRNGQTFTFNMAGYEARFFLAD
jgi:hypothetical protein